MLPNRVNQLKGEFWDSVTQLPMICGYRPSSYVSEFQDSVGSIVQLPYKGEITIVFNTEWHSITKQDLYHKIKKEVGVTILEGKLGKQFEERFKIDPAKSGYKRLVHFFCNSNHVTWTVLYVPLHLDLGDTNLDPRPSYQYFPASTLRPVKDWQF
jgi:hypothetical protein